MTATMVGIVSALATLGNENFAPIATQPPKGLVVIGYVIVAIAIFGAAAAWWLAIWSVVEDAEEWMRRSHLAHVRSAPPHRGR